MVARNKTQAQGNSGQGLSPAPFQNGASENEQGFYSDFQPVSGNADSAADNSSDRKNEVENEKTLANAFSRPGSNSDALLVSCGISDSGSSQKNNSALREVNQNDRAKETETLFQEPESGIQRGVIPADSFSGLDAGPDNRGVNFEVKNGLEEMVSGQGERVGLNRASICPGDDCNVASASCFDDMDDRFGGNGAMPEIATSARLASPANQASFDAGNATKKQAKDAAQMPQSNATNATMQNIEFAQPSGWGKLWRLVQNGNYYYYELRFINADRVRQKGGKITPAIARKLAARKGKGRHEKSRKEAERFRGAAEHLAERIRAIS